MMLHESVYVDLLDRILSGEMGAGSTLPSEKDLCSHYHVSRATVRNALARLKDDRLIVSYQGLGSYVCGLPPAEFGRLLAGGFDADLTDWLGLRCAIECEAARLAAQRRGHKHLAQMEAALEEQSLAPPSDREAFVHFRRADVNFHDAITQAAGNETLMLLAQFISPRVRSLWLAWHLEGHGTPRDPNGLAESSLSQHQTIFSAIRDGDSDGAVIAMREHISTQAAQLLGIELP